MSFSLVSGNHAAKARHDRASVGGVLVLGKQLNLSFVEADGDEALVEVDEMAPRACCLLLKG
jgi:hypothetical protein